MYFATVSLVLVGVLQGPDDFVGAVDSHQGHDFVHMMVRIEPALAELFVVVRGLRAQRKNRCRSCWSRALRRCSSKRPSVVGMFEVAISARNCGGARPRAGSGDSKTKPVGGKP